MAGLEQETEQALHLYRVFSRAFRSVTEHSLRDIKSHGLHPTEFSVLELLYHKGPQPLQQIGASILLASGSVTYVIDKLEQNGMINRQPCPHDRRVTHAELTEKGRSLIEQIFPVHAQALRLAVSGLSAAEKEQAIMLLRKLGMEAAKLLK
ncbi:MarR family transcriptional regulator [Brevibacillus humidisoli]|nr:MarR family transcriptional regulator [Brevibacillus humidisoli]UFJ38908.1 MarR family transcriptional regulator [Brevibacillus humidisoli]